jgi:hypothetical protein
MVRFSLSRLALCCIGFSVAVFAGNAIAEAAGTKSKLSKVNGTITAVDTKASTVTILAKTGSVVLNVTATTRLEVNDIEPATLDQVQTALTTATTAGKTLKGSASYDATTMNASKVDAEQKGASKDSKGKDR